MAASPGDGGAGPTGKDKLLPWGEVGQGVSGPAERLPAGEGGGGGALTFLSRNDAIRPKFLGCCMNLWGEEGGREPGPRGAAGRGGCRARGRLPSPGPLVGAAPLGWPEPAARAVGRAGAGGPAGRERAFLGVSHWFQRL